MNRGRNNPDLQIINSFNILIYMNIFKLKSFGQAVLSHAKYMSGLAYSLDFTIFPC